MRDWLISLQKELDKVLDEGLISRENGSLLVEDLEFKKLLPKINNVAMLARRLVCSVGNEYNCTRVGVWSYLVCCKRSIVQQTDSETSILTQALR
jgi:hypothetical protein